MLELVHLSFGNKRERERGRLEMARRGTGSLYVCHQNANYISGKWANASDHTSAHTLQQFLESMEETTRIGDPHTGPNVITRAQIPVPDPNSNLNAAHFGFPSVHDAPSQL